MGLDLGGGQAELQEGAVRIHGEIVAGHEKKRQKKTTKYGGKAALWGLCVCSPAEPQSSPFRHGTARRRPWPPSERRPGPRTPRCHQLFRPTSSQPCANVNSHTRHTQYGGGHLDVAKVCAAGLQVSNVEHGVHAQRCKQGGVLRHNLNATL